MKAWLLLDQQTRLCGYGKGWMMVLMIVDIFSRTIQQRVQNWLEREYAVNYIRDFNKDPVMVAGGDQEEWSTCAVGCKFGFELCNKLDTAFGWPQEQPTSAVLRSMESAQYYAENNLANARRWEGL